MDAVLLNLVGDVPIVTKVWAIGCVGLSLLASTHTIDATKMIYDFDLVFKKGQYERIIYSLFYYGPLKWTSVLDIFLTVSRLTELENSFPNKRRYCWMISMLLMVVIAMSSVAQPITSLGAILLDNLIYYQMRKNERMMNERFVGGLNISPLIVPLYTNAELLFVYKLSWLQVAMNIIPAHLIYYCDDVVHKLYEIDLCQTPYDYIVNRYF
ncbi:hypothetical protein ZYGR_0N01620 [Zygosaccharomyces rouxii]|uniref:Derlin n=2 Tax=Zygosaccharomyces rouxii TaxID=4956 RepID=C5DV59_ZYGRC|nr:uncharacterized protein ZYRO0D04092g [Zygosaccharomyces rouxii]KAH9200591.1 Derlin [Zygosaccharomyces rouxii]GAV48757.1 hypothetical protein ZYGR_0N01620 [Zygosaccharomyces rouxii]CAR27678.1 ZYRO0D04092p [Zygosaccharomyces rouxii]